MLQRSSFQSLDLTASSIECYSHKHNTNQVNSISLSEQPKAAVDAEEKEVTKLAIGTEEGFKGNESPYDVLKEYKLVVVMPDGTKLSIELPNSEIPEFVLNVCNGIMEHDGMKSKLQIDTWDADSEIKESKYAKDLVVLDNGKKISNDPTTWECEMSGARENLWLNLSR